MLTADGGKLQSPASHISHVKNKMRTSDESLFVFCSIVSCTDALSQFEQHWEIKVIRVKWIHMKGRLPEIFSRTEFYKKYAYSKEWLGQGYALISKFSLLLAWWELMWGCPNNFCLIKKVHFLCINVYIFKRSWNVFSSYAFSLVILTLSVLLRLRLNIHILI